MGAFSNALGSLLVRFAADSKPFQEGCEQAQKSVETLGTRVAAVGAKLATALPFLAIGGEALHAAEKFESAMRTIVNRTGATEEQLKGLEESFKKVYASNAAAADQVAIALSTLSSRTHATGDELEKLTDKLLILSKKTGIDVTQMAGQITRVFGDWSISTEKQGKAMDFLLSVSQKTAAPLDRIAQLIVFYGAPLREMGFNFQQAATLMGKFEAEGVNTETVMATLRIAIGKMAKEGIADASTAFKTLVERLKETGNTAEGKALAMETFGKRGGVDMLRSIVEGRWDTFLKGEFETADKAASEQSAKIPNWSKQWEIFKHQIELALMPLGQPMLQALTNIVGAMKPVVGALGDAVKWFTNLPQATQAGIAGLALVVPAINLAASAAKAATVAFATLSTAVAILTGPVGVILASLTGGLILATKLIDEYNAKVPAAARPGNRVVDFPVTPNQDLEVWMKTGASTPALEAWVKSLDGVGPSANAAAKGVKALGDAAGEAAPRLKTFMDFVNDATVGRFMSAVHGAANAVVDLRMAAEPLGKQLVYQKSAIDGMVLSEDDLAAVTLDVVNATEKLTAVDVTKWLTQAGDASKTYESTLKALGITSTAELRKIADYYGQLYQYLVQLRDLGLATQQEVDKAREVWTKAEENAAGVNERSIKKQKDAWQDLGKTISNVFTRDLASALSGAITGAKDVADAFKRMGQDILDTILHTIIAKGIQKAIDALSNMGGLLGKIGGWLGGIGGGGGGVLGTSVGAAGGAAATIGQAAGQATAGAAAGLGGIGGSMGGLLSNVIGFAGLGVSIASGITAGIQAAHTNTKLTLIEENTRFMQIGMNGSDGLNVHMKGAHLLLKDIMEWNWNVLGFLQTHMSSVLDGMAVILSDIRRNMGSGGAGGTVNQTITINITGAADPRATAEEVATYLKRVSPAFGV